MSLDKVVEFRVENGKFIIEVYPNKDGQNVVEISIDIAEVPDEVLSVIQGND